MIGSLLGFAVAFCTSRLYNESNRLKHSLKIKGDVNLENHYTENIYKSKWQYTHVVCNQMNAGQILPLYLGGLILSYDFCGLGMMSLSSKG